MLFRFFSFSIYPNFMFFFFNDTATTEIYTLSLHDALPLTALRDNGVEIAIDDYGTGQSTLSYLKQLPVDELKIDKSFVTSVCEDESDRIMVRSTINLGHELGLRVVAEGVEDAPTLELLRSLGCDYAQGYLIGKAMPVEQLSRLAAG